jgi:hypothetical protein
MLKLFEQIFRHDTRPAGSYPDELIRRAIERAVDATDPRMRILSSYRKKMRPAVIHAIDCVVQLVTSLSIPVPMSAAGYGSQAILGAMFASADSMRNTISCDRSCKDFAATNTCFTEPVSALLLAKFSQKHTYGYDLVDDKTVGDVPLTVVSFDEHRLIGLATQDSETRRLLQLRAFDYLLALALEEITTAKDLRQDLVARKKLLKVKLDIVFRSNGSLVDEPSQADRHGLQQKMDAIEAALHEAGADDDVLQRNLTIVTETLAAAGERLRLERQTLYIDNTHYLRTAADPRAAQVPVQILRDAHAREMAVQLITLPPGSIAAG